MAFRPLVVSVVLILSACDARKAALGRWEVVAIDGVSTGSATPLRVPVPAGAYDTLRLEQEWMWKEYRLASLVLELGEDGSFVERKTEASSNRVTRNGYMPAEYVSPTFGGLSYHDELAPRPYETRGTWTVANDSIRLGLTREAAIEDYAANLAEVLPGAADALRANLAAALPADPPPRWVGVLRGDRLELVDFEGRVFTLRKAATP